jgi:hypothetical protein
MGSKPWLQPTLITVLATVLTATSLLILAVRNADVSKIDALIDQNNRQESRLERLETQQRLQQDMIWLEVNRGRDRLDHLEAKCR